MTSTLIILTICLPWLGALGSWTAGDNRPRLQHALAAGFALAAAAASVALIPFATSRVVWRIPLGGVFGDFTFVPDGLGILLAVVVTRFLQAMLFETGPHDPMTYGTAALVFVAVSLSASYLPARRASSVDPVEVLKAE